MLEEIQREEKSGYKAEFNQPVNDFGKKLSKKEEEIAETYGDDFEEEIDEDLPVDDLLGSDGDGHRLGNVGQSLGGITVSQSLGVDPSVDSLALEDYDHVEPVERLI